MPAGDEKQRIRERAYELWEREGHPQGRHLDHWVQAERETQSGSAGLDRAGEGEPSPLGESGRQPGGVSAQSSGGPESGFGAAGGLGGAQNLGGAQGKSATQERTQSAREPSGAMGGAGQPARAIQAGQGAAEKPARSRQRSQEEAGETEARRGSRRKD
jgi:hypothetical protein